MPQDNPEQTIVTAPLNADTLFYRQREQQKYEARMQAIKTANMEVFKSFIAQANQAEICVREFFNNFYSNFGDRSIFDHTNALIAQLQELQAPVSDLANRELINGEIFTKLLTDCIKSLTEMTENWHLLSKACYTQFAMPLHANYSQFHEGIEYAFNQLNNAVRFQP